MDQRPLPSRAIVTGGAGFIGSHIVDRLKAAEATVVVIDNLAKGQPDYVAQGVDLVAADVASHEAAKVVAEFAPTLIVHCAAQASVPASFADPMLDAHVNILGTVNVLQASADRPETAFIYVTTGGALYGREMTRPWREVDPVSPVSPYGLSKWTAEEYLALLAGRRRTTILRLANVYGPRQGLGGEAGVVAAFIDRMKRGEPVTIHGDGEQTRDMVYVADVVEAVMAAEESGVAGGIINIASGIGTSVNDLFRRLAEILDYRLPADHGPARVGDIRHSRLDPRRAESVLGWRARTSLGDGLARTAAATGGGTLLVD